MFEEIKTFTAEQIETRAAEIKNEIDNADAEKLDALNAELNALEERRGEIAMEQRKAAMKAVAHGAGLVISKEIEKEQRTLKSVLDSAEYVDAYAEYIKTGKDKECRALLTDLVDGGTVPTPTVIDNFINTAWERSNLVSRVRRTSIKGTAKYPFEYSATGAAVHTEGAAAPDPETLVLGVTELVPASIKKWITISDEAMDLTGEAFIRYIYDELTYQIAKAAANGIIADIEACGTVSTTSGSTHLCAVPKVTAASIALGTVAEAIAQLSDEANNPVVAMNKQTWAAFKAVQYAGSYAVDPFEGLDVVFNNSIKSFAAATTGETYAIVGDFGVGAQMNFPNGEEITIKVDDLSLAEKDLVKFVGREYVAHDVVAPKAFAKIVK